MVLTFVLTAFTDLVVAVNVGVVLASLLFMRRMSKAVSIEEHSQEQVAADAGRGADFMLPNDTVVYSIDGPFFFGAAEYLEDAAAQPEPRPHRCDSNGSRSIHGHYRLVGTGRDHR